MKIFALGSACKPITDEQRNRSVWTERVRSAALLVGCVKSCRLMAFCRLRVVLRRIHLGSRRKSSDTLSCISMQDRPILDLG